jgi:hypothetical protein
MPPQVRGNFLTQMSDGSTWLFDPSGPGVKYIGSTSNTAHSIFTFDRPELCIEYAVYQARDGRHIAMSWGGPRTGRTFCGKEVTPAEAAAEFVKDGLAVPPDLLPQLDEALIPVANSDKGRQEPVESAGDEQGNPTVESNVARTPAANSLGYRIPPCPGCGSLPAASGDVDDVCPRCGEYRFHCGLAEHLPVPQGKDIMQTPCYQQTAIPHWERMPSSQVRESANLQSSRAAVQPQGASATPRPPGTQVEPPGPLPEEPADNIKGDRDRKGKRIDEKMKEKLEKDGTRLAWSAEKWAEVLGCSKSTVAGTSTWKLILDTRALREAARLRSKNCKPTDRRRFRKKPPKRD